MKGNVLTALLANTIQTPTGCLEWQGYCGKGRRGGVGYGCITYCGKVRRTHRVVASLLGWIDLDDRTLGVCHRCDNPPCINPQHLFIGSQSDNARDAIAKGRMHINPKPGSKHHSAKLTEADILAIRRDRRPQKIIAAEYGIDRRTVWRITTFRSWTHVASSVHGRD